MIRSIFLLKRVEFNALIQNILVIKSGVKVGFQFGFGLQSSGFLSSSGKPGFGFPVNNQVSKNSAKCAQNLTTL